MARKETFTQRLRRLVAERSPLKRVLEARVSARQRRALAPTFPHDAEQTLVRVATKLSAQLEGLLDRHVLKQLPVTGLMPTRDYGPIQRGLERVEELAVKLVSAQAPSIRVSGRKALAHAAREYERIAEVKLPGRFAADMVQTYEEHVRADLARIIRAQLSEWRGKALEAMLTGDDRELVRILQEASWVMRNRSATLARTLPFDLFSRAFERYAEEGGDDSLVWVTMRDEKVRESHSHLDGQVYSIKTGCGPKGIHPGQEANCRCRAIPVSVLRGGSR